MPPEVLRAARANRVFQTDEKRIRSENTVIDKGRFEVAFIQDRRLRTDGAFSSVLNRRSARTGRRPRKREQDADIDCACYFSNSFFLSFTLAHSGA